MTDSLCCTSETKAALSINYTPIQILAVCVCVCVCK